MGCELKNANEWNIFVLIINFLNNVNTVTLSIHTKSNFDDWWKHDGEGVQTILVRSRWQVRSVKTKKKKKWEDKDKH